MAMCIWQLSRALAGNELSWAYVFEWPLFAAYAVYMWWRLLHESPEVPPEASSPEAGSSGAISTGGDGGSPPDEDPERRHGSPTTSTWPSWPSATGRAVADATGATLRGEGSNLQHPAPKADVLPIELPRREVRRISRG